ncbi:Fungal specific transcription factor domain-containing protein [Fusarium austroafricanum]|uniref:Fungal specific transcription factor domain-containing protein n=1 Tax=Fusarium austroafricanum TaxID=2364996 RepID=A0A8H4KM65_9HYPO|nr:Fungal specific transcription factor domain-containing protein [Fusarium austroafricanum]
MISVAEPEHHRYWAQQRSSYRRSDGILGIAMSFVTPQSQPQSQDTKRRRAHKACVECNRRKVRCDLSTFTGNQHGAVSFVADLVAQDTQSPHYLVPHRVRKHKSPEDLEYHRVKRVFSVPPKEFSQHGYESFNLLLLWSMILVASSFEEHDVLAKAGYTSRKTLKRVAYERAKFLIDNAYNGDQITLIQSVILMSHWHAYAEDRFEAWHWVGIAISLCQTAGLHCRPLRIHLEDGDISPANAQNMEHDLGQLPDAIRNLYFSFDIKRVSRFWCKLVEISLLLGHIVSKSAEQAEITEADLSAIQANTDRATCFAFRRPRVLASSRGEQASNPERIKATEEARTAAVQANSVLEEILSHGLLRYMKSQSISALVPPMQIHLLDCKSSTTTVRVLGANQLRLCIQALAELKETYWAAEFALKLFERTYEQITRQNKRQETNTAPWGNPGSQPGETVSAPPLQVFFNTE